MDTTLQSIIEIALQQGIWAALYIYLFFRMQPSLLLRLVFFLLLDFFADMLSLLSVMSAVWGGS